MDDGQGGTYQEAFVITVLDENDAPSDLLLSANVVSENRTIGEFIGTFTTVDPDSGPEWTYTLVAGTGDDDNALFEIDVDQLKTTAVLDYEEAGTRSVLVEVDDGLGGTYQEAFEITVLNENEAPTDINLSNDTVAENATIGTVVGTLSAVDPDVGGTHTFALVAGLSDDDNALFQIDVDQLKTTAVLDYEEAGTRSVLVEVDDGLGGTYQEAFEITVLNENEAPTDINLSNDTIAENATIGTVVGTLSAVDPDVGDTHTYRFSSWLTGDDDNALFQINGAELQTAALLDYETKRNAKCSGGSG